MYRPGFDVSVPQYAYGGKPGANSDAHMQSAQQNTWRKNRGLMSICSGFGGIFKE